MTPSRPSFSRRAFSLLELLVVIGIIVLLVGILLPVVSRIRASATAATIQQQITTIANAIERYRLDFRAYPGPIPNQQIGTVNSNIDNLSGTDISAQITMAENLTLGLFGGVKPTNPPTARFIFDPALVGQGAVNLGATPRKNAVYLETANLSDGDFQDAAGDCTDSIIPELVDRHPDPMPILYLRARVGTDGVATKAPGAAQYDLAQILGYTAPGAGGRSIGVGKTVPEYYSNSATPAPTPALPYHGLKDLDSTAVMGPPGPNYYYPYDLYPYLRNPSLPDVPGTARQKDGFILISAGIDRIYGTDDDITNFGRVRP